MLHAQRYRMDSLARWWPTLIVAAALLWGYWPSLLALEEAWSGDPRYSHGYLVPLFSLYLVWSQRTTLAEVGRRPSLGGLVLVGVGIAMHLGGAATNYEQRSAKELKTRWILVFAQRVFLKDVTSDRVA
jgi:Transmembrane exosortase (Exosortase_EpsH)